MKTLRQTKHFKAEMSPRGVRISALSSSVTPRSRVVRQRQDWENYLQPMSDDTFDAACVWDFGIGVFTRP